MNERIRELLEQSGVKYVTMPKDTVYEKFAELIVRACAGVCLEQRQYQPKEVYAKAVLSHFGVEE